uniref:flagellar assembly protein FliW n=1 Tax=Treponema lecithinolyticum TaxID=53418 RepID=UPI0028E4AD65
MNIETKAMGIVSVDDNSVLHFSHGLYGFEDYTEFVLLESEYKPFMWLQSVKEKALAFLVVDPFLFFTDYEIDVDDQSVRDIGVKSPADVCIIVIITLAKEKKLSLTANLQGPLVINKN